MAAGRGMRMMPLTASIPKPMARYKETTLIGNAITRIHHFIPNIHITVGYKKADLARHVIEQGISSIINTEGKGNSWWLFNSLMKNLDEPVLVLTCDNIVELDYSKICLDYFELGSPADMVIPATPVDGLDGDFIFHKENKINELSREKRSDIYCSGIQVINPKKVNMMCKPEEAFINVWNVLISNKQLYCSNIFPEKWYAVDTIEHLNSLNNLSPDFLP